MEQNQSTNQFNQSANRSGQSRSQSNNPLQHLMQNPSEILNVVKNPGRYGMDVYKGLTTQQKQYVLFAAGAGLIIYGLILGRDKGKTRS